MKKSAAGRRKTIAPSRPTSCTRPPVACSTTPKSNPTSSFKHTGTVKPGARPLSRKASTPTHDKTARADSPDVSSIMPAEVSHTTSKKATPIKPPSKPSKTHSGSINQISLADQLDFEYTRYLQAMFARKLAEAEAAKVNDRLKVMQNRIADDQNLLLKTTERLKNITFNKEVETLHKLKNPDYGRVLETIDNANCKDYLETVSSKLEQRHNQLKLKNIDLPQGGANELFEVMKDTMAACEKLKANNNLEVPRIIADIKESNNSTIGTFSSCVEMVPQVEHLLLDTLSLETLLTDDE